MGRGTVVSLFWLGLMLGLSAHAAGPQLREEVSLNGAWAVGGTIPEYHGINLTGQKTYERQVTVPSSWSGRIIKIEFLAVNHKADVYVNNQLVGSHIGGWTPFGFDITNRVSPGSSFTLKVLVTGSNALKAASGFFVWPVGGWRTRGGIADDVTLRAYGKVHIVDAFIKTSTSAGTITVDYTVKNSDTVARTVTVSGDCVKAGSTVIEKTVSATVTLASGETKTVTASASWTNATLYWPDRPQLYHLASKVVLNGTTIDSETRRFGFREIKIVGNQYTWNGVRINLFGDYQSYADTWYVNSAVEHSMANWPATIDRIKALNIRCLRWHHNPPPRYVLDVCDEKGLLICNESPNYGREFLDGMSDADQATYVSNFKNWCGAWIKQDRNRPSVYTFNATNEMTYAHLGSFSATECRAMGDQMRSFDGTRPIGYDGDISASQETYNYHYPEGYNREPSGSIYSWAYRVKATQPTGSGEVMHAKSPDPTVQTAVERNKWWLGIWTRGLRYTNWTDVRPACFWFADKDLVSTDPKVKQRGLNLKNCYAPVALFDKAYDDLGIAPYVTGTTAGGTLPSVTEGTTLNRTLVLYNDEFSGTSITIECLVRIGSTVYASGTKTFTLTLGEHMDIPVSFQVPYVSANTTMEWVLRTYKGGVMKFEEPRRFTVVSNGTYGTSSNVVTITGGTSNNVAPVISLTAPVNGSTYTAPASVSISASASDSDGSVTKVEFFANGTLIGTSTAAPYAFTWTGVAAGTYSLTAKATDNGGATKTSSAISIAVSAPNQAPTVAIASPASGATFSAPATVNITASASDSDGSVTKVEFFANGTLIGTSTAAPYAFSWTGVAAGTYTLTAKATDNKGATKTSTAVNITVNASAQRVVSFTLVNADTEADIGALTNGMTIDLSKMPTRNLNIRANASPSVVGSVMFGLNGNAAWHLENGAPYAFAGGTANDYNPWTPPQGTHTVTATPYTASGATGTKGTPLSVSFTVIDPPAFTSMPSATGSLTAGQTTEFSAAASDPNGDTLTYSWNFGDGSIGSGASVTHTYTAPGSYTVQVSVSDGKGGSASTTFNVQIAAPFSVNVNFQSAGAATPAGYVADTGAAFGSRGNGYSYGWNSDNSSTARDRDSAASPSQLYDTLQHLQKPENPNAKWEIAVPNGSYSVRVVAGDASYFDSVYQILVEGVLTVSATPTSTRRWAEGTQVVTVSDGRLTISNGAGSANNKICFVEIASFGGAAARSLAQEIEFEPLRVREMRAGISYSRSNADTLKLKLEVNGLGEKFPLAGTVVSIDAAGAMAHFVLDARGGARSRTGSCSMKLNSATGAWVIAVSLIKGNLGSVWSDGGVSKTQRDLKTEWPVTVVIGDRTFGGSKAVNYQCRSGSVGAMK
ncbi:MAG TPA: Ig-like domain-containing protein [Planctomycetota bacterium]|nr:Ig-like domain-containing protein [Planctomycetota bacterium]